jgi:hypothetical protein
MRIASGPWFLTRGEFLHKLIEHHIVSLNTTLLPEAAFQRLLGSTGNVIVPSQFRKVR